MLKSKDLKIYPPPSVSAEEVERLKAYHWPGNIRELENLIERELIYKRGKEKNGRLTFEHLDMLAKTTVSGTVQVGGDNLLTLDEGMSRQIRQALQKSDGRISGPRGASWNKSQYPPKQDEKTGYSLQTFLMQKIGARQGIAGFEAQKCF